MSQWPLRVFLWRPPSEDASVLYIDVPRIFNRPSLLVEEVKQPDGVYKPGRQIWCAVTFDVPASPSVFDLCDQGYDWLVLRCRGEDPWCLEQAVVAPHEDGLVAVYGAAIMVPDDQEFYR